MCRDECERARDDRLSTTRLGDASGQGRPVDDPVEWKICSSRPGPNQQITDFPVVFGVVRVSESCKDKTPK